MDALDQFAVDAEAFCTWAMTGTDTGEEAARAALDHLLRLYPAALRLMPVSIAACAGEPEADDVSHKEWRAAFLSMSRLPFDYYGSVFDPFIVPPEEMPTLGSLCDDLADIYRDVLSGLRAYRAGWRASATWEWTHHMQIHWGQHAVDAIRVLHNWLADHTHDLGRKQ